jgi:hypothetical protein
MSSDLTRQELQKIYQELDVSGSEGAGSGELQQAGLAKTDPHYDEAVRSIYKQAHDHRGVLVGFYRTYISCFTIAVFALILAQAIIRVLTADKKFEIMPSWTMDLLVSGMFVQFVGLLKIVTENVWNFKSFFDHHNEMRGGKGNTTKVDV